MPRYLVPMYFIAETEVEASSPTEAIAVAGQDEDEFNFTATYVHCPGGPSVYFDDFGTPRLLQEEIT